jgi:hypothetical protein
VFGALATTGTDANRWALTGLLLLAGGAAMGALSWHMRRQAVKAQA